jgi:hypothetical protein
MNSDTAQAYVAQVMGGANNTAKKAMALDSIKATAEKWTMDHDWHFLLNTQTISVLAGTSRYALTGSTKPFHKPFSMRFTGTSKDPLTYITQDLIDAAETDLTVRSTPKVYTVIDDDADFDPATEVQKVQFFPVPVAADTAVLRYYRVFNGAADPIDVPLRYLYTFLDCARIHLLQAHDSANPRLPALILDVYGNRAQPGRYDKAILDDTREGGEAVSERFLSPFDVMRNSNSIEFWPKGDR